MRASALLLIGSALFGASTAHADEPRFEVVARGVTVQAALGMSRAGYRLTGDLGGESAGIRSFGSRWLLTWDVLASFRAGVLANKEPYLSLFGMRASAFVEPAYRFFDYGWSPIVSARLGGDVSVLWNGLASLGDLRTLNDMDGVGGVVARGLVRVGGGASYVGGGRSLSLQLFGQELLQGHGVTSDGLALSMVGGAARFDWTWGLSASIEATAGTSLSLEDPALQRTSRTTRIGAAGSARKIFSNGMWLGLFVSIAQDSHHVTYETTQTSFVSSDPADFTLGLSFGVSLWRPR